MHLNNLTTKWRTGAAMLRTLGSDAPAVLLEKCAADVEAAIREHALEALTLDDAVAETGYSYSAIQKMVAAGTLANVGAKGSPRVRRGDLPRKARRQTVGIAERILNSRLGIAA